MYKQKMLHNPFFTRIFVIRTTRVWTIGCLC